MLEHGKGLFSALTFLLILGCSGVLLGQVDLVAPEVEVREGDRQVEVFWRDADPEPLTYIHQPVLGTIAFPWRGNAGLSAEGFYLGACDWTYNATFSFLPIGAMELSWREVIDWETGAQQNRAVIVSDLDTYYEFSAGIRVKIDSEGLFTPDLSGWSGPVPVPGGIYVGGQAYPESTVSFTFTCTSGGDLSGAGGAIGFDWESRQDQGEGPGEWVESGSFTVDQAGTPVAVARGLKVTFPEGTYVAGESFGLDVRLPLTMGDRFSIVAETFEGYLVLRSSIEDRPGQYKVISNISKCDSFDFFQDEGEPDPYGERYFIDLGISSSQPGVTPGLGEATVLNGFPYRYAVATYDVSETHEELLSPLEWYLVYPSVSPPTSASEVFVVPNPYVREAGWETDGAKVSFMNVPDGTVIEIYDASGNYVDTVDPNAYSYDESLQQGTADWDLKNADGTDIVSGIYIYKLESDHGDKTGRFIVVR